MYIQKAFVLVLLSSFGFSQGCISNSFCTAQIVKFIFLVHIKLIAATLIFPESRRKVEATARVYYHAAEIGTRERGRAIRNHHDDER